MIREAMQFLTGLKEEAMEPKVVEIAGKIYCNIRMHKTNHPNTKHYCEDVWQVDPVEACKGYPVGLAWFSPDCKHFSKAKGGKPKDKFIRGLAWVACRWAGLVRPRVIMLENVEEFKTYKGIFILNQSEFIRLKKIMKNSLLQQKEQVHFQYRKKTLVEIQKLDCLEYANSYLELIFLLLFNWFVNSISYMASGTAG